jgi:GntR family transcriptional regulator
MLIHLDFKDDVPIYMQIRNQIVMGIAEGKLAPGEKLPTIRTLAEQSGINMMTVNKAYQLLKQEGYIITDRRNGAMVCDSVDKKKGLPNRSKEGLRIIISEARLSGISKEDFLKLCDKMYEEGV